jgi:MFS family permease
MLSLGVFAAIYHPVGTTMLIAVATRRGQALAMNGVAGNLGAALAAAITAGIAAFAGWRAAFIVPGIICVLSGFVFLRFVSEPRDAKEQRTSRPEVQIDPKLMVLFVSLFALAVLLGGLLFTAVTVSLPKIVDERMGGTSLPITLIGSLATAVFICGAATQLVVGRLVERYKPVGVFVGTSILQVIGLVIAWATTGIPMLAGLAIAMAGIYGQITVNDVVVARFTADAWRGRVYAVRFFLGFGTAGLAVAVIGFLHEHGGFEPVFQAMIAMAAAFVVVIAWIAMMAYRMEARAALPAE